LGRVGFIFRGGPVFVFVIFTLFPIKDVTFDSFLAGLLRALELPLSVCIVFFFL